ncbi:GNAT family N-acetyltransferase [Litoribrevibacter albus]|uniref:N-acetyltransferase n=1 Tax=Litoribrevibacter albus TaxID=1473156 RepID=A0AA37W9V4_9GAMM|nr:GNAT family N-acetyltransferase [Litoribrevibacter albus]GLQ33583.1 N-acetyltransferase [Litoribrevibacter albus]
MIIEAYKDEHQDGIIQLIVGIQRSEFDLDITADDQPDLMNIQDFYITGKGNFWVAVDNDHVVGTISLLDIGDDTVALRKMFVAESHRGKEKGVANQLLNTAFDWAEANQLKAIYLGTTSKFLAAHRFYEKNGFSEILKSALPEAFPIMTVDTKFYKREIG